VHEINNAFERRLLIAVDAAGYGGGSDQEHFALQSGLAAALNEAAALAALKRDLWVKQAAGDGELAILPHGEPEAVVVDDYVRNLEEVLSVWNAGLPPGRRIRLRMAVHFGAAMQADNGWAGQGVVAVSRLVDSSPVRAALSGSPEASLALILSRTVFEDVVRQGHVSFPVSQFARVLVHVKEYRDEAWIRVAGLVPPELAQEAGTAAQGGQPAPEDQPVPVVTNTFPGTVHAEHAVFGISYGARRDD
jgi:hypothetical protein